MTRTVLRQKWLRQLAEGHWPNRSSPTASRQFGRLVSEVASNRDLSDPALSTDQVTMILNMLSMSSAGAIRSPYPDFDARALLVGAMMQIFVDQCVTSTPICYACEVFWKPIASALTRFDEVEQDNLGDFLLSCLGHESPTYQEAAIEGLRDLRRAKNAQALRKFSAETTDEWLKGLALDVAVELGSRTD